MSLDYEDLEGRWLPVDSTCASHLYVYGPDLLVRFRDSGEVYVYSGAGKEITTMLRVSSIGTYINSTIKTRYKGEHLRNPPPLPRTRVVDERY